MGHANDGRPPHLPSTLRAKGTLIRVISAGDMNRKEISISGLTYQLSRSNSQEDCRETPDASARPVKKGDFAVSLSGF